MRGSCGGYHLKPMKTTDTVTYMYNQITGRQALNLSWKFSALRRFSADGSGDRPKHPVRKSRSTQAFQIPPLFTPDSQVNAQFADAVAVLDWDHLANPFILDQALQTFTRALGITCDDNRCRF